MFGRPFRLSFIILVTSITLSLSKTCLAVSAETLSQLADASGTNPTPSQTLAIETAVSSGLPETMPLMLTAKLPVYTTVLDKSLGVILVPKEYITSQSTEPQSGTTYPKITYLYSVDLSSNLTEICQIHYTVANDLSLSKRIASLLSLAQKALVQNTRRLPANGSTVFNVWIDRAGLAGAEQWGSNIYFYDLDAHRSSIEWIREIVHEYAHLALPGIGGYRSPEYWANGYLGERLIVRWLYQDITKRKLVETNWGDFSGYQNFARILIDPSTNLYERVGPSIKYLKRTDDIGMRYLIGEALIVDQKYGGNAIGEAFGLLPLSREAKGLDFGESLWQAVAAERRL